MDAYRELLQPQRALPMQRWLELECLGAVARAGISVQLCISQWAGGGMKAPLGKQQPGVPKAFLLGLVQPSFLMGNQEVK